MSRLDELKTELTRLTIDRNEKVAQLQAEIRKTNRAYDRQATKLAREIAKLEPVIDPTPKQESPPKRKPGGKIEPDIWAKINEWNRTHNGPR